MFPYLRYIKLFGSFDVTNTLILITNTVNYWTKAALRVSITKLENKKKNKFYLH